MKELEKNDLLVGQQSGNPLKLDKFLKYFDGLNPRIQKRFTSGEGNYSETPSESINKYFEEKSVDISDLSDQDIEKIKHYDVRLSESGKKAFDIIVKVIAEQINKK